MRADRLVSLVLLLRQRSRLTAPEIASALEVSTRTVLRDIDALSAAGVPVYAVRGRHGGFALLPGFRTELTGLTDDEALALLSAGADRGGHLFGLGPALAGAIRKVVDALPTGHPSGAAAGRILLEPTTDLLSRRPAIEQISAAALREIRRAVVLGRRLRILYATADQPPTWRTVDPVGLVTVRAQSYLLALRDGTDRTYRLTRIRTSRPCPSPPDARPKSISGSCGGSGPRGSWPAVINSTYACWSSRPGAMRSSPRRSRSRQRSPSRTAGSGSRSGSRTSGTRSGRCGSSGRTRWCCRPEPCGRGSAERAAAFAARYAPATVP